MSHLGDLSPGTVVDLVFNTEDATGAPITLAGTPAVSVYHSNDLTQTTTGVTMTVDFDGRTGLHHVRIDTSADGTFYAAGRDFHIVITTGTVNGISVVGKCVGSFSLNNRAAVRPTVAGRTLDVTATGAAGIDWANVENPTTALNLSGTNIDPDQVVASVAGAVGSVTGAVGSVAAGVTVTTNNDKTGYALSAAAVQAIWDALTSALTTVGSIGKRISDNLDAVISTRATPAQVNTEVLDVLTVDTFAEPTGTPAATITLATKLGWLYMALRNKLTVTSSAKTFFDDTGAAEWKKTLADDSVTYSEDEAAVP